MSMREMNPKTKKAYEEAQKRYEEDRAAAIRILAFITRRRLEFPIRSGQLVKITLIHVDRLQERREVRP